MKRIYINAAVSISAQGFTKGFTTDFNPVKPHSFQAAEPLYKDIIPPSKVRRMSKITRMALMCALSVDKIASIEWDGILTATALGNIADTERFLTLINSPSQKLNAPTSFTQASHNNIGGQIALLLKNNGYNMCHVQRDFSFENALLDASLQLECGLSNMLVGAFEEHIPLLDSLAKSFNLFPQAISELGEGTSFFHLSNSLKSSFRLREISLFYASDSVEKTVAYFLEQHHISPEKCITILASAYHTKTIKTDFQINKLVGRYFTNCSFAFHFACSQLKQRQKAHGLIINQDMDGNLSLTLIDYAPI